MFEHFTPSHNHAPHQLDAFQSHLSQIPSLQGFRGEIVRSAEELFAWAARRLRLVAVGDRTVAAVACDRWCVFSSCLLSHISQIARDLCVITGSSDKIRQAFFPRCLAGIADMPCCTVASVRQLLHSSGIGQTLFTPFSVAQFHALPSYFLWDSAR